MHHIVRTFHFSAGHRIPHHAGKCAHPHGHTYGIEVTLQGPIRPTTGQSDGGMVADFADVKRVLGGWIDEHLDHGMMIWQGDSELLSAYKNTSWKHYIMPDVPTAEHIGAHLHATFTQLMNNDEALKGVSISQIVVQETPAASAIFRP